MTKEPTLLSGKIAVDDRGEVGFVNEFDFSGVKRFYTVANHQSGFVRAWHGHRNEAKYVTAVRGAFVVCCIKIDDWDNPASDLPVNRYVLSDKTPSVLYVPMGYVNGFKSLKDDAKLMFFSTSSLNDTMKDDIRFPAEKWDAWAIEER
jgi:dTDP-4-dehydrorhamnose 3,5-epimerase-like enzyme